MAASGMAASGIVVVAFARSGIAASGFARDRALYVVSGLRPASSPVTGLGPDRRHRLGGSASATNIAISAPVTGVAVSGITVSGITVSGITITNVSDLGRGRALLQFFASPACPSLQFAAPARDFGQLPPQWLVGSPSQLRDARVPRDLARQAVTRGEVRLASRER